MVHFFSVTSIGDRAFYNCTSLTDVYYYGSEADRSNMTISSSYNNYFTNATWHYNCQSGKCGDNVSYFFDGETLTLSGTGDTWDYTYDIEADPDCNSPFYDNRDIKNIIVESGVTGLGNHLFDCCINVESISLPEGLTKIGESALTYFYKIESVTLPDSVRHIGANAFTNWQKLKSITIPDGVTSIESETFLYCYGLKYVVIPKSVTSVGDSAFMGCTSLTDVYYYGSEADKSNMTINSTYNRWFTDAAWHYDTKNCGKTAYYCYSDEGTILNIIGFGNMYDYAEGESPFDGNTEVDSIDIADGITSIGAYSFCNMPNLYELIVPGTVAAINEGAVKNSNCSFDYVGTESQWDAVTKAADFSRPYELYNVRPEIPLFDVTVSDTVYGESTAITVKCPKNKPTEDAGVTEAAIFYVFDENGNEIIGGVDIEDGPESDIMTGSISYPDDLNEGITNPAELKTPLESGKYYVNVRYTATRGTGKYISRLNCRKPFTVGRADPNFKITVPETAYGEIVYAEIEVPENIRGSAVLSLSGMPNETIEVLYPVHNDNQYDDDDDEAAHKNDGKIIYDITGLNSGDYTLTFDFKPESSDGTVIYPNYNAETVSADFTVNKADPDFSASTESRVVNTNKTEIQLKSNAEGTAKVTVGSKQVEVTLNNGSGTISGAKNGSGNNAPEKPTRWLNYEYDGKATVKLDELTYGKTYSYTAEYLKNENYNTKTVSGEFKTVKEGKIGENVNYLLEDGVLTLSGTGVTYNYSNTDNNPSPVDGGVYRLNVESIVISPGVTGIGSGVFSGIGGINDVLIPENVTSIGEGAFSGAADLTDVFVPAGCTVAENAFDSTVNIWRYTSGVSGLTVTALEGAKTATQIDCDAVKGYVIVSVTAQGVELNHSLYVKEETIDPTCTEQGYTVYRCSICGNTFNGDYTDALNHDWGAVSYSWEQDGSAWKCEAKRVCTRVSSHIETETVNAAAEETKAPTCTEKGETTYTAVFTGPGFKTQVRTIEDIDAPGHKYGTQGDERFTCTVCGAVDDTLKAEAEAADKDAADTAAAKAVTDMINALPEKKEITTADEAAIKKAREAYDSLTDDQKAKVTQETVEKLTEAEKALAEEKAEEATAAKEKAKAEFIAGVDGESTDSSVIVKWGKVPGAKRYVIYAAYCDKNHTYKYKKIKTVSGKVTKYEIKKLYGKKLNPKRNVKVYIVAQKKKNGKWKKIFKTPTFHIAGAKGKFSNVQKITVKKAKFSLKKGKTAKIKAKLVLADKSKKAVNHVAKFRYKSTNTAVVKVTKSGKIKAVGKGTATVFVYSNNGTAKAIKVTVK